MATSEDLSDETSSTDDEESIENDVSDNDNQDDERSVRKKRETVNSSSTDGKCGCLSSPSFSGLRPWIKPGTVLDPAHAGNPVYGFRMQLYCRTGFHLAILHNGKVLGSPQEFNKFAVVELSSVDIGEIRIRAVESNLYLAMNGNGRLYGEENMGAENTVFLEKMVNQYNTYRSKVHRLYVSINKYGKVRNGFKAKDGQKCTHFLSRRIDL